MRPVSLEMDLCTMLTTVMIWERCHRACSASQWVLVVEMGCQDVVSTMTTDAPGYSLPIMEAELISAKGYFFGRTRCLL